MRDRSQRIVLSVQKEMFKPLENADIVLNKPQKIIGISNIIGNVQYSCFSRSHGE